MQHKILKYLLDIESIITEIDEIKTRTSNDFNVFQQDIILQRAIERDLEIIGEAVRNILEINPNTEISSTRKIIGLRNIISHAYDSVEPQLIWAIIQKDIPILQHEIQKLKQ